MCVNNRVLERHGVRSVVPCGQLLSLLAWSAMACCNCTSIDNHGLLAPPVAQLQLCCTIAAALLLLSVAAKVAPVLCRCPMSP